ncbi:hypothetical protein [Geodermatophilus sp. SYSU D01105]
MAVGALGVVIGATALVTVALDGPGSAGRVPLEVRTGVAGLVVTAVAIVAGRLTGSTRAWPGMALLAAQPVPVLLVPPLVPTVAGFVLGLLATVLLDVLVLARSRGPLVDVAEVLVRLGVASGVFLGPFLAWVAMPVGSWTTTGLLAAAGAVAVLLPRCPRLAARLPSGSVLAGGAAVVVGLALAGSLLHSV